jgi:hypothetical protein
VGLSKNTKTLRIVDVLARIRTEHLPNTSVELHLYNNLLGVVMLTSRYPERGFTLPVETIWSSDLYNGDTMKLNSMF